jgi:hypothetical protein
VASHISAHKDKFPQVTEAHMQAAQWLNDDFSEDEVGAAVKLLKDHKATGVDGWPAEFISHACYFDDVGNEHNVLVPHITGLFNKILKSDFPSSWADCAVVPVYKGKGDATLMDNYRGIAVGGALSKLFSLTVLARLDAWAEDGGWRAKGQAGFRAGRGTLDNIYVLNHAIEKSKKDKKAVFTAFIDFKKAYDSVNRTLLWEVMKGMGVHGLMLDTLRGMYASVGMRVRINAHLGEQFMAETGVKQGDPLSPLLFGLFIDRIESYLLAKCVGMGVPLAEGLRLVDLLYADDLTLATQSAADLQKMLDCLHDFSSAFHLTVNVAKSVVVVFNRCRWRARTPFTYAGGVLPIATEFTYLGIKFTAQGAIVDAKSCGLAKARVALHGMVNRCRELGCYNVIVQKRLFEALVVSVLNYGCQVWAPYHLATMQRTEWGESADVEDLQKSFLRSVFQVPKSTTVHVMMCEARCSPLMHKWFELSVRWWNKVVARSDDDLVKCAVRDSIAMADEGNTDCWGHRFLQAVGSIDPDAVNLVHNMLSLSSVAKALQDALSTKWCEHSWGDWAHFNASTAAPLRDINVTIGFKSATYRHWFCHDHVGANEPTGCSVAQREGFAYHVNNPQQIRTLATFRMSAHKLNIESMRHFGPNRHARHERLCQCCTAQAVEDEMHVFECSEYETLRGEFANILSAAQTPMTDSAMYALMNPTSPDGWKCLAAFLYKVFLIRSNKLAGMDVDDPD